MSFELSTITANLDIVFFVLDLFIVYFLVYRLLVWVNNSHAEKLTKGLFFIFVVFLISRLLKLTTLHWMLGKLSVVLMLLIIILFQPELRRFLERLGAMKFLFTPLLTQSEGLETSIIKHLLRSIELLSREKIGALIVIEIGANLSEYIDSGIKIVGNISSDLIASLFWPGSPTHDGAIIIRGNKLEAAGCLLPLSTSILSDRRLGTRHRAAMGISEVTDALVIVVSEETGIISMAEHGNITRYLTKESLETRLFKLYKETKTKST
jgi:diadenylate cyclase